MERKYFVLADIHGSYQPIRDFHKRNKEQLDQTENILILLGDVGANYFLNNCDDKFKIKLGKYPFTYFCIRGNHEERPSNLFNVDKWHMENFEQGVVYVENKYPYIKYALDYPSIYALNDKWLTLVFPGAYSIDKYYRLEREFGWFKDEQLTNEEMILGKELTNEVMKHFNGCDLVLSHTCPIIYEPTDLFLSGIDQSTVDKTMEKYLGEIECGLNYKLYLWGHYHQTRIYPKYENRQLTMLYNDYILDLDKYMETKEMYNCLLPTWRMNSKGIKVI